MHRAVEGFNDVVRGSLQPVQTAAERVRLRALLRKDDDDIWGGLGQAFLSH